MWAPRALPRVSPGHGGSGELWGSGLRSSCLLRGEAKACLAHSPTHLHSQVFFTRNGKIIGKKDAVVPSGGFFPTIGMLSCGEKVKVDLHPLSG